MCIIVYKPVGANFPQEYILENCFDNNPDGAGFMYAYDDMVHIEKGLMTFKAFKQALKKIATKIDIKKVPFVLHFRITTHGKSTASNTHPFPLTNSLSLLEKTNIKSHIGIAHNGIVPLTADPKALHSDTMIFIAQYLSLIIQNEEFWKNKKTLALIEKLADSKLAILNGKGHCELIGENWVENEGSFYSNSSFQERFFYSNNKYSRYYYPYYYDDDFEVFFNEDTNLYDFEEDNCPSMFGINHYCEVCADFPKCQVLGKV